MCYLIVLFIRVFEWLYKLVYISIQFDDKIFYNSVWASRSASIRWKYSVGNSWKFFKTFAEHLVTRVWVVFRTVVCVEALLSCWKIYMQLVNFCRSWHKFTKMPVCYLWGEISCFLVAMLIPSSLILQCIFSCLSNADISYKTVAVIGMILSVYVENAIQTDQTTSSLACIYLEAAKTGCLTDFTCVNCDYDNGTNCVWW